MTNQIDEWAAHVLEQAAQSRAGGVGTDSIDTETLIRKEAERAARFEGLPFTTDRLTMRAKTMYRDSETLK